MNWQDSQLLEQRRQVQPQRNITARGQFRVARVLRAGSFTSTSTAQFWDCVLLASDFSEIDMNYLNRFDNESRPVYPLCPNCMAHIETTLAVGDIVCVALGQAELGGAETCETLSGDYDVAVVATGQAVIIGFPTGGAGSGNGLFYGQFAGMLSE